ncbi:DoxX family protein [Streptomyces zagrosensis]|uniref:Putative oxidoreductase n=1 Tax=Streptomyces zagrosensis TaxID=1042984 RepID=A0A7W9Q8D2_9ACTN|nr:DoxX family protein [Streptomyces zagrosensis]MBB5934432.1 putative oxidoreductase [Streptomyces zagrosensis]
MSSPPSLSTPPEDSGTTRLFRRDRLGRHSQGSGRFSIAGQAAELRDAMGPYAIAAARVVFGLLFACHGASGFFDLPEAPGGAGGKTELTEWPMGPAGAIQIVGGGLLMLGLGTRIAALICSGSMAYGYFDMHQPTGLWPIQNGGEEAAIYCWGFLLFVFTGPGALSADGLLRGRGLTGLGRKDASSAPYSR